ncbi:MBL fold metallo-hydrolase [Lentzea sp. NPDC092896]|uniref:MBL fold metallo-hydrolase n=1 Tax=Lentzea sp. NPDC092896 TaxID=3364127 RepID=UPI00381A8EC4
MTATAHQPTQPRYASTLPVPSAADGPKIPDEGYLVQEIADQLYWLTDGSYGMMFSVADEGVIAVDAPPTLGHNITRAIAKVTSKPVTDVIYSHQHSDHIGASSLYPDTARRYAHRETARQLSDVQDKNRPVPTDVFDTSMVVGEGKHSLQLDFHGPNHSTGNIHIFAPAQKTLMFVDVIFPGWVPFAYLAVSADIPGWIKAHHATRNYDFDTLVAGHLTKLGTPADVDTQIDYVTDLQQAATQALASVDFAKVAGPLDHANGWAMFGAYFDAVAGQATDEIVPRWADRLAGADVFTWSNAWAMAEAVNIDFGTVTDYQIHP